MPAFKGPQYTKTINPKTGLQEPRYIFPIEFSESEDGITFVVEDISEVSLKTLQKHVIDNITWWNTFVNTFLQATSKLFSKPYTVDNINKIVKHTLDTVHGTNTFPANVTLFPKTIEIAGGIFWVNWRYTLESVIIDIPDLTEPEHNTIEVPALPDLKKIESCMEELNIDDLPVGTNSTEDVLELDSPAKFFEKQRVKEARLKAKLAIYKAQRQMAKYIEKYGNEISDSDTDYESSDEESQKSSEEDEIQI